MQLTLFRLARRQISWLAITSAFGLQPVAALTPSQLLDYPLQPSQLIYPDRLLGGFIIYEY